MLTETIRAMGERDGLLQQSRDRLLQQSTRTAKIEAQQMLSSIRAKRLKAVDVCFVVDATASMEECLAMVARKVEDIGNTLCQKLGEGASVRVACVGYRDYGDEGHPQVLDFTADLSRVQRFMHSLEAENGGDVCEDILGGLEAAAARLTWKSKTRILFLLPQTEQHGRRFHEQLRPCCDRDALISVVAQSDLPERRREEVLDRMSRKFYDLYPEDPRQWGPVDRTIARLRQLKVSLVCLTLDKPLERMLGVVRGLYDDAAAGCSLKVTSMKSLDPVAFLHAVTDATTEAVGTSVLRSGAARGEAPPQAPPLEVILADPDWDNRETWHKATATSISYETQDVFASPVQRSHHRSISIYPIPFGQGEMRLAFYVFDEVDGFRMVGKVYKYQDEVFRSKTAYEGDMTAQAVSRFLAKEFSRKYPEGPIEFVAAELLDLGTNSPLEFNRYMALEPWIPGKYEKYTNNTTYIGQDSELAQAFSHFTYEETDKEMMVTDIQGVRSTLTDPQIHCQIDQFGRGNLGAKGQDNFFCVHRCNHICSLLKLPSHPCQMAGVCAAGQEAPAAQKPAHEPAREPDREPAQEPATVSKVDAFLSEARRDAARCLAAAAAEEEEEEEEAVAGACLRWLEEPEVVLVRPGSAAELAGVVAESRIVSVGGRRIAGMPREQVLRLLEAADNVPVFRWPDEALRQLARHCLAEAEASDGAVLDRHLEAQWQEALRLFLRTVGADARAAAARAHSSAGPEADVLAGAALAWERPPRVVRVVPRSPAEALLCPGAELVAVGGQDVTALGRGAILSLMQREESGWELRVCRAEAEAAQLPFAPAARPRAGGAAPPEAPVPPPGPGADEAAPPQAARRRCSSREAASGGKAKQRARQRAAQEAQQRCRTLPPRMRHTQHLCSGKCGKMVLVDSAEWVQRDQRAFCAECKVRIDSSWKESPCSTCSCDGIVGYSEFELRAAGLHPPRLCGACTGEEAAASCLLFSKDASP